MKYNPADDHEPLFDVTMHEGTGDETSSQRRRSTPSVAFASCPDCMNMRVGLIPSGEHLVYRTHYRQTYGSDARLVCRAVGSTICTNPPPEPVTPGKQSGKCRHDRPLSGYVP